MDDGQIQDSFLLDLCSNCYAALELYARRVLAGDDLAQDAVQETFLKAMKNPDAVKSSPNPFGWLFLTLRHTIGSIYLSRRRLQQLCESLAQDASPSAPMELHPQIAFRGLIGEGDLALLCAVYCEGRSHQEAADALGISPGACSMRLRRARKRFRDAYTQEFLSREDAQQKACPCQPHAKPEAGKRDVSTP